MEVLEKQKEHYIDEATKMEEFHQREIALTKELAEKDKENALLKQKLEMLAVK